MTKAQHTPAPWFWVKGRTQQHLSCTGGGSFASVSMPIVGTKGYKFSPEMCARYEANARLIAAAPELLEALRLFGQVTAPFISGAISSRNPDIINAVNSANAAIAKATKA